MPASASSVPAHPLAASGTSAWTRDTYVRPTGRAAQKPMTEQALQAYAAHVIAKKTRENPGWTFTFERMGQKA